MEKGQRFSDHEGYTIDTDRDGIRERESLIVRDTLSIRTGMGEAQRDSLVDRDTQSHCGGPTGKKGEGFANHSDTCRRGRL